MPHLILSDVHSNCEALQAVIEDARGLYDSVVCLGDIVGYGADPNFAAEWMHAHSTTAIRGNHDKLCVGLDIAEVYNPAARVSAAWTRQMLTAANAAYLSNLPRGPLRIGDFDVVHGSPLDEDEYVIHAGDAAMVRDALDAPVTFFGHTHIQGGFLFTRGGIRRIAPNGVLELEPKHRYLLNPGSVGQPRDLNPKAAYALYTPEDRTLEFRRVKYDIAAAARKILDAGLPSVLAARLYEGA